MFFSDLESCAAHCSIALSRKQPYEAWGVRVSETSAVPLKALLFSVADEVVEAWYRVAGNNQHVAHLVTTRDAPLKIRWCGTPWAALPQPGLQIEHCSKDQAAALDEDPMVKMCARLTKKRWTQVLNLTDRRGEARTMKATGRSFGTCTDDSLFTCLPYFK